MRSKHCLSSPLLSIAEEPRRRSERLMKNQYTAFVRFSAPRRFGGCVIVTVTILLPFMGLARAEYTANLPELIKRAEPWPANIEIKHLDSVNREVYRQTADVFFQAMLGSLDYWLKQPKPYPNMGFHLEHAVWLARMYDLDKKVEYAEKAAKCLEHAHRLIVEPQEDKRNTVPGWDNVRTLYWIDHWLKGTQAYTPEHQQWVKNIALKAVPSFPDKAVEYGAFNRSFGAALMGECLLSLIPDAPGAKEWRKYIEGVWAYWWQFRDTDESTDHYNALWFQYLLDWVVIRNVEKQFWKDDGVKRMMERYLYYVFPMGAFPHVSDSCGWNVSWGHWIWVFEACATAYRDGRYKWAAHGLYDYATNRIESITSWGYTDKHAAWSLLKAYGLADDAVAEKPRDKDVVLLKRHDLTTRSKEERERSRQFLDLGQEMIPDKIVMTSSADRNALSLIVDVVKDAGHSHNRRPTLLALADRQSVLLMSLGYMDRRMEDHNMPTLIDYEGYPYDNTPYHIPSEKNLVKDVSALDLGPVGYGRIRVEKFHGYPATLDREIVFIKNAGLLIKDTLTLDIDLRVRWGSLFRARNVGPDFGENWVNTYLGEWIPLRGLGKNAAVLTRWRNSPRDLMIYYLPKKEGTVEVVDESGDDKTNPIPLRIQYTLRQDFRAQQPLSSTAILLPHAPGNAKPLADKVNVLLDEPARTALKFFDAEGGSHFVILNRSGQSVKIPGVICDGQIGYVCQKAGKVESVALHGGKQLIVGGRNLADKAAAVRADRIPAE